MTKPCQIGLKCPYCQTTEDGLICVYPYACVDEIPEDETFGFVDEMDCPLVEYPSALYDLLDLHDAISNGTSPSEMREEFADRIRRDREARRHKEETE